MKKIKLIYIIITQSFINLVNHDGIEHAGYMSFMLLLSLFPFLIFFLNISYVFGASHVGQNFIHTVLDTLPSNLIQAIEGRARDLYTMPPQKIMSLAIISVVWTASSFIESMRTILNRIYISNQLPSYLWRRFLSIVQFFIITFAIFILMTLWITLTISATIIENLDTFLQHLPYYYEGYFSIGVMLFVFVNTLYYIIPNTKITFLEVAPGALITVALWLICGYILSTYISYYTQLNFVYGSLGSIIIVLLFFYIVSLIFIYGAEFNHLIKSKRKLRNLAQKEIQIL